MTEIQDIENNREKEVLKKPVPIISNQED